MATCADIELRAVLAELPQNNLKRDTLTHRDKKRISPPRNADELPKYYSEANPLGRSKHPIAAQHRLSGRLVAPASTGHTSQMCKHIQHYHPQKMMNIW